MADSSSSNDNSYLKSWSSCETLVSDNADILCHICKESFGTFEETEQLQSLLAKATAGGISIFKSTLILHCEDCPHLAHLHCVYNIHEVDKDIVVSYMFENSTYNCHQCNNGEQE